MRRRGVAVVAWVVEVALPAVSVLAGILLLAGAAFAGMLGLVDEPGRMRLFVVGLACWASGILWGAFVNDGWSARAGRTRG